MCLIVWLFIRPHTLFGVIIEPKKGRAGADAEMQLPTLHRYLKQNKIKNQKLGRDEKAKDKNWTVFIGA